MPILIVVYNEVNEDTGQRELIASHGFDLATGKQIVVQNISPKDLGALFSLEYGEWIIPDREKIKKA